MTNQKTLDNKLRLLVHSIDQSQSCTALVLVGAGSRYETLDVNGISHFLEHMFFKGAKKYKNTKEVSEAIDTIGGEFNAFTGKEYAGYYVKVAKEHAEKALDVLSDMLLHAKFDPKEIDKERGVILEEYNMYQDTPMYQIGWDFEKLIFGDQPIGRDQIGTKKLINSVTQKQFQDYQKQLYTPDNTVIALVGDFENEKAFSLIEKYFQMPTTKKSLDFKDYKQIPSQQKLHILKKQTEQAHLVMGFNSLSNKDPQKWALKLLATALGGNMSSRMFLNVREAKGLCYYIHTDCDMYSDCGTFATRAGVDVTRAQDAIDAIKQQYEQVAQEGISQAELDKSKSYLKGKMQLKLEDSESYAHFLARQSLILNEVQTPDQIKKEIDKVSLNQVNKLAKEIIDLEQLYVSVIGPYTQSELKI